MGGSETMKKRLQDLAADKFIFHGCGVCSTACVLIFLQSIGRGSPDIIMLFMSGIYLWTAFKLIASLKT